MRLQAINRDAPLPAAYRNLEHREPVFQNLVYIQKKRLQGRQCAAVVNVHKLGHYERS
jgi:hypothetical protein